MRKFDATRCLYDDEKRYPLEDQRAIAAFRQEGPDPDGNARFVGGSPKRRERLERIAAGQPAAEGKRTPSAAQVACAQSMLDAGRTWYCPGDDPDPWPYVNTISSPGIPWPGRVGVPGCKAEALGV